MSRMPPSDLSPAILLPKQLLADLHQERDRRLPKETGGFLLGYRRGPHIEITGFTSEQVGDRSASTYFQRSGVGHAREIRRKWQETEGLVSLVGDWHSHPSGHGIPSGTDVAAWRSLRKAVRAGVVGLILGANLEHRIFSFGLKAPALRAIRLAVLEDDTEDLLFG